MQQMNFVTNKLIQIPTIFIYYITTLIILRFLVVIFIIYLIGLLFGYSLVIICFWILSSLSVEEFMILFLKIISKCNPTSLVLVPFMTKNDVHSWYFISDFMLYVCQKLNGDVLSEMCSL